MNSFTSKSGTNVRWGVSCYSMTNFFELEPSMHLDNVRCSPREAEELARVPSRSWAKERWDDEASSEGEERDNRETPLRGDWGPTNGRGCIGVRDTAKTTSLTFTFLTTDHFAEYTVLIKDQFHVFKFATSWNRSASERRSCISGMLFWYWSTSDAKMTKARRLSNADLCSYSASRLPNKLIWFVGKVTLRRLKMGKNY